LNISLRPRDRVDPRFTTVAEAEHTQGLTNEELAGVRSNLRESIFLISKSSIRCFSNIFIDNDKAIEALHEAVKRQKEIGIAMNNEVDRHNEIIDTITDRTGLLDARVKRQTLFTKTIDRKSSALGLWIIIIILFIAIVVIIVVPFK
jgi:hypothetical protein